jgi:hypothetical protein
VAGTTHFQGLWREQSQCQRNNLEKYIVSGKPISMTWPELAGFFLLHLDLECSPNLPPPTALLKWVTALSAVVLLCGILNYGNPEGTGSRTGT